MKMNVDYIWDDSPRKLYTYTIQIKTGKYADIILDYWNACIISAINIHELKFDYEIISFPNTLNDINLNTDAEFQQYLSDLIVNIIAENLEEPLQINTN